MEKPCNNCADRKWYARKFDIHFSGEDCPHVCQEYEQWKNAGKDGYCFMKTWIVPFLCYYHVYAFTPPEDHVSQIKGELYVYADFVEQAIQLAEIRLSRLGFNKIMIAEDDCREIEALLEDERTFSEELKDKLR